MITLYVLINGSLKMSKGKVSAQVAHAVSLIDNSDWLTQTTRKVVVLEAKNAEQMNNFSYYLHDKGYDTFLYIDEGANEVPPYSLTAMAVEPNEDDEEFVNLFKDFKLYGSSKLQNFFKRVV